MAAEPTKISRPMTSADTVLDRPSAGHHQPSASGTVVTTDQAMAAIEAKRAWAFSAGLGVACIGGLVLVAISGGDPLPRALHAASLVATGIVSWSHVWITRDPTRNRRWMAIVVAAVSQAANTTGYWYWGPFSAYMAVVPVSAYSYASGSGKRDGTGIIVASIGSHVVIGLAAIFGWWRIESIIPTPPLPPAVLVGLLVVLQGVVLAALAGGNHAYRVMQTVVDEHGAAVRELAVRDAQLAEAHQAARDARGPDEGRHSGEALGRFKLGAVIGRGAMGEVYAATDDRGEPCAVKVLAAAMLGNDDAVRRFQREARAVASLESRHIVRTIDVSPAGSPVPFIAMERLAGRDLGDLIKERPVREALEVAAIVRAVASGLDAAHEAGVVHRDLKPANLYAASAAGGVVWKILDFGVSKVFGAGDGTLTAGQVVGTPGYMAPEQARGDEVDRRADVYSLGVVAYRLLTGRPAVVPGDVPAMVHEVVYRMPPAPSAVGDVEPAVEAVLAIALAKSAGDRFATAGELSAAFDAAVSGKLAPELVARAEAIVAKTPWGQWTRRAPERRRTTVADQRMP